MNNFRQDRTSVATAPVLTSGGSVAVGTFVAAAVAHIMVDFMGMSVWPVYKTLAGLDVAKAGWIATVIAMSGTALQPLFGSIADRFGQRRVILLGGALDFVCFAAWSPCRSAGDTGPLASDTLRIERFLSRRIRDPCRRQARAGYVSPCRSRACWQLLRPAWFNVSCRVHCRRRHRLWYEPDYVPYRLQSLRPSH